MKETNTAPNYSYTFRFESDFVYQDALASFNKYWTYSFYYVVIYVVFIFGGQHLMKYKAPFRLKSLLVLWNIALATFSIMGAIRTIPEFLHVLTSYGTYHSVCVPSFIEQDRVASFWTYLFILSKLPELGDTVFIVLRKQPLIFLHWYHHITVLLYCWYAYSEVTASARWFIVMNYSVHAVMYSYYALRAMGLKPPRQIAMVITSLQLIQMVIGCVINFRVQQFLNENRECRVSQLNVQLSLAMYFSYFVLFARFFYKTYISGEQKMQKRGGSTSSPKSKVH